MAAEPAATVSGNEIQLFPLKSTTTPSQPPAQDDSPSNGEKHISMVRFAGIIVATWLSFVLIGLDSTIVAIAVPTMTQYFGTVSDVGWYTSIYRLTAGSFQFLFGRLYNAFPTKHVLMFSLAVFAGGSLLCSRATTSSAFIAGRAITGFATAGVISGAFAVIMQTTQLRKRSTYAGLGGALEAAASLTAPLIGGVLTDELSWRWCFYVELPLIGIAFLLVFLLLPVANRGDGVRAAAKVRSLDLFGTVLFVPALTSLILALQWGGSKFGWSSWEVGIAFGAFVVFVTAFAYLQYRRQEAATVPPRILLQRSVLAGVLFSGCNNGALATIEYYMPIYLQAVAGMSAARAGVLVLPTAVGLIVSVSLSGILTSHFGYYSPFMILTSVVAPPAAGLLTTLGTTAATWKLIVYQGMLGCGAGIGFQGPQVAVQAIFSEKDSQIGIAIIQFAQGVGPAISIAAAQAIFTAQFASNLRKDAPDVNASDTTGKGLTFFNPKGNALQRHEVVISLADAFSQTFYLPVALTCVTVVGALCIEWRSVKTKQQ